MQAIMDDKIRPKTERSMPSKIESSDDLLTVTLHPNSQQCQNSSELVMNGEQSPVDDFNKSISSEKHFIKDTILTSSQYITAQSAVSSIGERSWDSHVVTPPILNTEIVLHGHHKQNDNSSSTDTLVDSDIEIKQSTGEQKKLEKNLNIEYDYIFCIATINKTTPNNLKLLAISKIDRSVKVDMKSDGSSLNGYAADHSSSSTSSTVCSQVEPFVIPKVPRDSFMSSSSSGSSIVVHSKSKSNNILLSKNIYTDPENLVCHKCNYVYPKVSDSFSMDNKDIKNESHIQTQQENVKKSRQKQTKQLNMNNNCSAKKKTSKKIIEDSVNNLEEKAKIKLEGIASNNVSVDIVRNQINDPILFDIGNKVLAYWVADKLFYPAVIIDIVSPKFKVKFLSDFVIKSVNIDCLVHSESLKQGTPIAIFDTVSQEYRVGDIVSINQVNNGEITYTIDLDSEEVVVPFDKLVLDVEKARSLQDKIVFKSYDRLSMSNVSEGKRLRLSRSTTVNCKKSSTVNTKNESSKRKRTKQSSSDTNRKRRCLFPEEPDPRCIPSTSTGITEEDYEAALNPVSSDSDFDHIREELTNIDMGQLRNSEIDSEHSSPEKNDSSFKVPVNENIKVFENLHFIISYAKFKRIPTCNDSDQSTDSEVLKSSNYFKPDKVHRRYLEKLITKNGGNVQQYCNVIPRSAYKNSYIITDTPSHTCNYFLGLGLGIPSYHHKYVENAVLQKIPFPEYLAKNNIQPLPNGWSVEMKKIIFRSPNTVHSKIFSDFIIYLAFLEAPKNEFFAGLLRFCGAIVYTTWTNGVCMPLTRHTTIIITDEHCPSALAKVKVPKLSLLWLVQSLICESARPFEGHETYIAINDESTE